MRSWRQNNHWGQCLACKRPIVFDNDVPVDVIVDNFIVVGVFREAVIDGMALAIPVHPYVCGDSCYGAVLRDLPEGYQVTDIDADLDEVQRW